MAGTLAVGFFDGVHLGHQSILAGADGVLTFRNHPLSVLAPERAPRLVMSLEDRLAALRASGVGEVTAVDFTRELADLPPEAFASAFLAGRKIRCGENWRFGRGGRGDAALLRSLGFGVTVVPSVDFGRAPISSTRIRADLESGSVAEANAMMGRPFAVRGVPFRGKGEGRSLGYPTVNLNLPDLSLRLPCGVYAVSVGEAFGLANFGTAPTFGARAWKAPVLEIHFPKGLPGNLDESSGGPVAVRLHRFIRPERRFGSLDALRRQIADDVSEAGRIMV